MMHQQENISSTEKRKKRHATSSRRTSKKMKRFGGDDNQAKSTATEAEINPSKLEKDELSLDIEGATNTKGHQPYEI